MAESRVPTRPVKVYKLDADIFPACWLVPGPVLARGMSGEIMLASVQGKPHLKAVVKKYLFDKHLGKMRVKLFLTEVRMMKSLRHPNIVKVSMAAIHPGYLALYMEYYSDGTLLNQLDALAVKKHLIDFYLVQIACAVRYIHGQRVAHCDIKLQNVFIDARHNAILGDFSVAVRIPDDQKTLELRKCAGTAAYRAPEARDAAGDIQVDPFQLDAYALGVLLWAMVFRRQPCTHMPYLDDLGRYACHFNRAHRMYLEALLEPLPSERLTVSQLVDELKKRRRVRHLVDIL